MSTAKDFKDFVKRARSALQMTQAELADKLGLERRSILRYERGDELPNTVLYALKHLLDAQKKKKFVIKCKQCGLETAVAARGVKLPAAGCCRIEQQGKKRTKVQKRRTGERRALKDEPAAA